jgi:hypothetical protein
MKFYIKRTQFPEYFNGWNEWGPCWSDRPSDNSMVSERALIRYVTDISKKDPKLTEGLTILVAHE